LDVQFPRVRLSRHRYRRTLRYNRIHMRYLLVMLASIALASAQTATERLNRLLHDAVLIDTHIDTPWYMVDEAYDLGEEHGYYEADIPRLRRGHVGAVFFGIPVEPQNFPPHLWIPRALELIDAVHQQARQHARDMEIALTAEDVGRIHRAGKIAALMGVEGGHMIQDSLPVLRDYYRLGVRYMTLTHFKTNDWADSSTDVAAHNGLSPFGRDIVREMNRLGMMVDISHVSDKTFYDAIDVSRAPVIASHSSLRALCDIPRNMSDDMIRALARKGGVVNINFNTAYLDRKAYDAFIQFRDQRDRDIADMMGLNGGNPRRWEMKRAIQERYRALVPKVGIDAALRMIDHAVKVAGADHVGFGSDFDGVSGMVPSGMEDVSKYPELVRGLIDMGYPDADIRKIMGENLLRVMRTAEEVAQK
jgi:membrane dipeptidase